MRKILLLIVSFVSIICCIPSLGQGTNYNEMNDSIQINDSLAYYYANLGNMQKAHEYEMKNVAILKHIASNSIPNSVLYAISLLKMANYLPDNQEKQNNKYSVEGLRILKDSLGYNDIYIQYLLEYVMRLDNRGDFKEAIEVLRDAAHFNYQSDEQFLGSLYFIYAHLLRKDNNNKESLLYAEKAKEAFERNKMEEEDLYYYTIKDISYNYYLLGDSLKALEYLHFAKNIIAKTKGEESIDYLDINLDLSYLYSSIDQNETAIKFAEIANAVGEKRKNEYPIPYIETIEALSKCHSRLEQYNEAICLAEKGLSLAKECSDFNLEKRLPMIDSLISYYRIVNSIEQCNSYAREAYQTRKNLNLLGEALVPTLYYLLQTNYLIGKYEECEKNMIEIREICGNKFPYYKHYYDDMKTYSFSLFHRKLYQKALDASNEIADVYTSEFGEKGEFLARLYSFQAQCYSNLYDLANYRDCSLKSIELLKAVEGLCSPYYLYSLSDLANHFFNFGFYKESYGMFKDAAEIAQKLYGRMHLLFAQNYLSAMTMWDEYKGELIDDYKIDDLYRFLLFQRVLYAININEYSRVDDFRNNFDILLSSALSNLIQKYSNDNTFNNSIYDCFLLQKTSFPQIEELKLKITKELGYDGEYILEDFCKTNTAFLLSEIYSPPTIVDSLYNRCFYYINSVSKKSLSFRNFYEGGVTVNKIMSLLDNNEMVIDYIPQKHLGDNYIDYFVVIDKERACPSFIPITNISKQLEQLCRFKSKTYFFFEIDSLLSINNSDLNNINLTTGYNLSIEHLLRRSHNDLSINSEAISQRNTLHKLDDFLSAYSEFEIGKDLYNEKQYKKAIEAFIRCDSLMYSAKGERSNYFGHGKQWIASCYHKLKKDSIANCYSQYYFLQPIDMKETVLSDSILDIADSLYNCGSTNLALEKYEEASKIERKNLGRIYWYANTLSHCAEICIELGDFKKAVEYETEAFSIRKDSPGIDHIDYYWSLKNMFDSYQELGLTDKINEYGEMLIDYFEKHWELLKEVKLFYPIIALTLAKTYIEKDDYSKAYSCYQKTIDFSYLVLDFPPAYMNLYYNTIMGLGLIGRDSISFELCQKIIPFYEKYPDDQINPNEYFHILTVVANHYYNKGDYITASVYQEKAMDKAKNKNSVLYGTIMSNLALTYSHLSRLDESIKYAEKAVMLCDTTLYKEEYAKRLINLAHCYSVSGDNKKALRCGKEAHEILKELYGEDHYSAILSANNLSTYLSALGYDEECFHLLNTVIEHCRKDSCKYEDILAAALNDLALFEKDNNLDLALSDINESYELRKKLFGESNPYTCQSLYNKGTILLYMGNLFEALDCIKKALDIVEANHGRNNLIYTSMMKILPLIYSLGNNLKKAIQIEEEITSNFRFLTNDYHPEYLQALKDLSELYFYSENYSVLKDLIIEISKGYNRLVISDFPNYTTTERASVLRRMESFFDWLFPLICYYQKSDTLNCELYNAQLLRKGLLLNSEIEFNSLIRESGDSSLINLYNSLVKNKTMLNRMYQMPIESRTINLDSLRKKIADEEDQLVISSKIYGDYTRKFNTVWENVRDKLGKNELAVEFVMFEDTCKGDKKQYYALVVDCTSKSPQLVPLCTDYQISSNINSCQSLYDLIWKPIIERRSIINTIYFSPIGILNNIGIEYEIPKQLDIDFYRLSSTRELLNSKSNYNNSAVLYGGLSYNIDTDSLAAKQYEFENNNESPLLKYRGMLDSLFVRGSFDPLSNTFDEIKQIGATLLKHGYQVYTYSKELGTEESFKELSGKRIRVIHLATHGMYVGSHEAESKRTENNFSFILVDNNKLGLNYRIIEDQSLSRSFLVMAGGNKLPIREKVAIENEDEILTALEISKLDLRDLDLVTLSACQTALGDIDNDGVYGLQRGFKKAGANTILMSLDKVDDEATKILMVEFYKNLMSGKTKHQSLKNAQKYLRQIDNGKYDKPEYWASFIMLDGLN